MASEKDIIEFNGITFVRYPNGKSKTSRRYYHPYQGSRRAKGVGMLHQEIWKSVHGPIPPGHDIHHRDGNQLNNHIDNLECLTKAEHASRHAPEFHEARVEHINNIRHLASEWHRSEEGRAWHREHWERLWKRRKPVQRTCVECGATYGSLAHRETDKFCSRLCISRYHERNRTYYEDRTCVICGDTFNVKKSRTQRSCSRLCGAQLRKRTIAGLQS